MADSAHRGDAVVDRLRAGANAGARLTTETVNAVAAGGDVLIEQVSTMHTDEGDKVELCRPPVHCRRQPDREDPDLPE